MGRLARRARRYIRSVRRLLRMHWMIRVQLCAIPAALTWIALFLIINRITHWVLSFENVGQSTPPKVLFWVFVAPMVGTFLAMACAGVLHVWLASRSLRVLSRQRGSLCPRCLHDLLATPESSRCPECGTRYRRRWLRKLWRQAILLTGGRRAAQRVDGLFETQPPPGPNQK